MSRTAQQIDADIAAVKANPNEAKSDAPLKAITAFTNEKNQLNTQAGKDYLSPIIFLRCFLMLFSHISSSLTILFPHSISITF